MDSTMILMERQSDLNYFLQGKRECILKLLGLDDHQSSQLQ